MDLSTAIHLLGDILGVVLSEQESPQLFEIEERIRLSAKFRRAGDEKSAAALMSEVASLTVDQARAVASAFAIYFDLVNLAEENERVQALRAQAGDDFDGPIPDTIEEAICELKTQGISQDEMAVLLADLSIELVLTAHPTEAKRRTILSKIQRIADILQHLY